MIALGLALMSCVVDTDAEATPRAVKKMPRTAGKVSRGKVQSPLLRKALTDHLVGSDTPTSKKYSVRAAAKRYNSVNATVVGARAKLITSALSLAGSLPVRDLIAAQHVSTPGDFQNYFTPDEEKQMVEIAIVRDSYGFGLDKTEFCAWASQMANGIGCENAKCGRHWYTGFLARAKQFNPKFGESKRSKIDAKRAAKHSPAVMDTFFAMVADIYEGEGEGSQSAGPC